MVREPAKLGFPVSVTTDVEWKDVIFYMGYFFTVTKEEPGTSARFE